MFWKYHLGSCMENWLWEARVGAEGEWGDGGDFVCGGGKGGNVNWLISGYVWKGETTGFTDELDIGWREREESKVTLRFWAWVTGWMVVPSVETLYRAVIKLWPMWAKMPGGQRLMPRSDSDKPWDLRQVLSVSQFHPLWNGDINNTYLIGLLSRWSKLIPIKHLEQILEYRQHPTNIDENEEHGGWEADLSRKSTG